MHQFDIKTTTEPTETFPPSADSWPLLARRLGMTGIVGMTMVLILIVVAIFAPLLAPYDPQHMDAGHELESPSARHWMGTDEFGRDVLSRTIFGSQISLGVAFIGVTSSMVLGGLLGLLAGVARKATDALIMRTTDLLLAFPDILLGILIIALLGPGSVNVALAIAIANIAPFARIMRAKVYEEIEREYVDAARALGSTTWRLTFRHLMPNCISALIIKANFVMVNAILIEAGLSFIGLGAQVPEPSWGLMLRTARGYLHEAPFYALCPGIALSILMIGVNFTADSLRNVLDPKTR